MHAANHNALATGSAPVQPRSTPPHTRTRSTSPKAPALRPNVLPRWWGEHQGAHPITNLLLPPSAHPCLSLPPPAAPCNPTILPQATPFRPACRPLATLCCPLSSSAPCRPLLPPPATTYRHLPPPAATCHCLRAMQPTATPCRPTCLCFILRLLLLHMPPSIA